jgi:hypothetical protein
MGFQSKPWPVVAIAAAALCGCQGSFFIASFAGPTEACEAEGAEPGLPLTEGVLDLAFAEEYTATAVLRNLVADPDPDGAEAVRIEGANVRVWLGGRPENEGAMLYAFHAPASGQVAEGESARLPFVALPRAAVDVIRQTYPGVNWDTASEEERMQFRALVTLGVELLGTTTGGRAVETPESYLPLRLCYGCLVEATVESRGDEESDFAFCESVEPVEDQPSRLGLDEPLDCRLCAPTYGAELCREMSRMEEGSW